MFTSVWEGVGVMVRENLIDIRLVALTASGDIMILWEKLFPLIEGLREHNNWPRFSVEYEYLYNEIKRFMEEHAELKT